MVNNKKKGVYVKIYPDPTGSRKDYVIETGTEFDTCKVAVDYVDLLTIKNDIIKIEERVKQNDRDFDS